MEGSSDEIGDRILLRWTICGVLKHLAQTLQGTYFGLKLAQSIVGQGWHLNHDQPDILAIGRGTFKDWHKTAKRGDAVDRRRLLNIIMQPIPLAIEDYGRKIFQLQHKVVSLISELLCNRDEPGDLANYLLHELGLNEARPRALAVWLEENVHVR